MEDSSVAKISMDTIIHFDSAEKSNLPPEDEGGEAEGDMEEAEHLVHMLEDPSLEAHTDGEYHRISANASCVKKNTTS